MSLETTKIHTLSLPANVWKIAQITLWLIGLILVLLLLFKEEVGIMLFWNFLIPVAPAILVVFPGVWRNICPMSTTALLPKKLKIAKVRKISLKSQGALYLLGVVTLLVIVPLRHLVLNVNGPATAAMLLLAAFISVIMGMFIEWRSGWCASACPIHSVERLYGSTPLFTTDNAHCSSCQQCVSVCPDATKQMTSAITRNIPTERLAGLLITGGFLGFIWGWYQVPDYRDEIDLTIVISAYSWPLVCGLISLAIYLLIKKQLNTKQTQWLNRAFATASVICYYWYRIPSLFGVGIYPTDGVLIDLSLSLPVWFELARLFLFGCIF
jgi:ferredoxin